MNIKLIVGLGNPGPDYSKTRHNAGFWLLDDYLSNSPSDFRLDKKFNAYIAESLIAGQKVILLKPMTFMNLSGDAVQKCLQFYKIKPEEMLVIHDELDFPAGIMKIKQGGGHGGHNGLRDIITKTGNRDFVRLRVGIGRPAQSHEIANYVLKAPSKDDKQKINDSFIDADRAINTLITKDISAAMLQLHT